MGWGSWNDEHWHMHYVPMHPECFVRIMTHLPVPQELERYKHWWEGMPEMSWWDKFWSGSR